MGASPVLEHSTQRLQCSSFLNYDLFWAYGLYYTPQKGTTFEPLGSLGCEAMMVKSCEMQCQQYPYNSESNGSVPNAARVASPKGLGNPPELLVWKLILRASSWVSLYWDPSCSGQFQEPTRLSSGPATKLPMWFDMSYGRYFC